MTQIEQKSTDFISFDPQSLTEFIRVLQSFFSCWVLGIGFDSTHIRQRERMRTEES